MTDELDTLELAKRELGTALVPTPEDILSELGPLGQLWFTHEVVEALGLSYAVSLGGDDDPMLANDPKAEIALAGIMTALGNLTAACIALGMLPPEAAGP